MVCSLHMVAIAGLRPFAAGPFAIEGQVIGRLGAPPLAICDGRLAFARPVCQRSIRRASKKQKPRTGRGTNDERRGGLDRARRYKVATASVALRR